MKTTLVVMAAGMGSRFGGLKQVEPIGPKGEAILDFSVFDAKKAGFDKVVFVIKHQIEKDFIELVGKRIEKTIDVEYVYQETDILPAGFENSEREKPWGTGHAILCCKDVVDTPFAVINADDFYGFSAFDKIHKNLVSKDNYCMVGFKLENTVTENGYVSRGICKVKDGLLEDIKEITQIDSNFNSKDDNGNEIKLASDAIVSMNMWGFTTDIFKFLEEFFIEFLKENIDSPKAEFYLPTVVDKLIKSNTKNVDVLVAEDKWYGVTYKEDKETVVNAVKSMIDAGNYQGM